LQAATPELVSCFLGQKNSQFFSKIIQGVPPKLSGSSATTTLQLEWISFLAFCFTYSFDLQQKKEKKVGKLMWTSVVLLVVGTPLDMYTAFELVVALWEYL
jgi:hypothetical protein